MAKEKDNKFIKKSEYRRSQFEVNRQVQRRTVERQVTTRQRRRQEIVARSRQPIETESVSRNDNLSFVKTDTVNTLYTLTELNPGQTLKDVVISHWNSSSNDAVISMYWSITGPAEAAATVSAGRISSQQTGNFIRIFTMDIPHASVISLEDSGITRHFGNFNKTIYFYVVSSQQYTQFTVIKS
tara:strand:- start:870 stop:1421 length:552 start_codon:yes stop_codon:yes gene_type:complete